MKALVEDGISKKIERTSANQSDMTPLTDFLLRAKPWHLFLLFFVFPNILEVISLAYLPSSIHSLNDLSPGAFLCLGLMFAYMFGLLAWFWSVGIFLNLLQKPTTRLNVSFFRFAVIFVPIYMPAFFVVTVTVKPAFDFILPIHMFATLCTFYIVCFVAKSVATVNKGRQVSFRDYAKPLLLLLLFPIGIWSIQARIDELYQQHGRSRLRV